MQSRGQCSSAPAGQAARRHVLTPMAVVADLAPLEGTMTGSGRRLAPSAPKSSTNGPSMPARRKTASEFRSARWFAPDDLRAFGHRSRFMQMGYGPEDWV